MKPSDEILITRFIEDDLAGAELAAFEARLETDPELLAAVEAASEIGIDLSEAFAGGDVIGHDMLMAATSLSDIEVPNAEAFNAEILDRIAG